MMREYKRYDEYKDSGVEWIGEIPEDWSITKLKYFTTVNMGQSVNSSTVNILENGIPFLQGNAEFGDLNPKEKHYTTEPKKIANINEILISVRAPVGDLNITDKKYCIGRGLCAIKPKNNLFYLYELLKISKVYFDKISTGSTYDSISTKDLKNIKLPMPPKKEKQKIASFLDQKTAEIKEIINKKESLIDHLEKYKKSVITEAVTKGKLGDKYINENGEFVDEIEMEDSGIQWIGEIPIHLELIKIKTLLKYLKEAVRTGPFGSQLKNNDMLGDYAKVYNQRNVLDNNFSEGKDYVTEVKFKELKSFEVKTGDILITTRGTIGVSAVVPKDIEKGILHPCLMKIKLNENMISKKYFQYIMNETQLLLEQFKIESNSTTIDVIYQSTLLNVLLPLMKIDIQNKIVDYLNLKTKQINNLIQKAKQSIEKYKEYKKSLIFEAVTGKIDLRDYELEGGEELAEHKNTSTADRERISAFN